MASPENSNTWETALSEAAFMTGLECNADVVYMTSYAPLLAHIDAWQWTPDLIWFDNLTSCGTPNYYVQKLFSTNRGTNEIIFKIVSNNQVPMPVELYFDSKKKVSPEALLTGLQHKDLEAMNTIDDPENIIPVEEHIKIDRKGCTLLLEPYSLTILKLNLQ